MDTLIFEKYVEYSAEVVQILTLLLIGIIMFQRKYLFTYSTKWILQYIGYLCIYVLIEYVLFKFIFHKSFMNSHSWVLQLITYLDIKDMNFLAPLNYLIKFIFLSLFFRDLMKSERWKKFFQYLMFALVVFELVQVFVFKGYQGYDSLSSTVKNVFILFSCGLFFYKFYHTDVGTISLQKNTYYWLILGLFIPALTEFFLESIFTKLYQTDLSQFYKLYLVRNASQIIGFVLLGIGIWQAKYLKYLPKNY